MPITEERALEILAELIKKPESRAEDVPRIWAELISLYNATFAPPSEPVKKKKRRRAIGTASANIGWPQGVSRAEYKMWKDHRLADGVTEGLNPQEYKRLKNAGVTNSDVPTTTKPAPKAEAKPAPKSKKGK